MMTLVTAQSVMDYIAC